MLCIRIVFALSVILASHYWKDYDGEVPMDAISAGTDKEGKPVYVGQIYMKDHGLLPATIVPEANFTFTATGSKVIQTNKDIKILCSIDGGLKWLSTKAAEERSCSFVNGGAKLSVKKWKTLYIGRANYQGETKVGQIFPDYRELYIPYNGEEAHLRSYEILSYNCIN
ncbi:hypothetical protein RI129_012566 [Pyrocoelia pectoralis]|uniref:Uncharacterized protein n=1 Tax=Pyrocoelia pectoralis TaxID=417401 RepID=A0AAN7ZF16_9COLE